MTESDGLTAALVQLSDHTGRIGSLDEREAGHYQQIGERLVDLGTRVSGLHGTVTDQGEILRSLDGLDVTVSEISDKLAEILPEEGDPKFYVPIPAPRWWQLKGAEREAAIERLANWVEHIYKPGYGHLAAALAPCWPSHTLCLYTLDWLSELWGVFYLPASRGARVLAGVGEFQTRLLPAAAEQLAEETSRCSHAKARTSARPLPPARAS
jgi:hypothetical protein